MNLPDNSDNSYSLRAYPNIKQPNNIDYELSEKSRIWLLPKGLLIKYIYIYQ